MINPHKLDRLIRSRESMSNTDYLIKEILDKMSVEQRKEIRALLRYNKKNYHYDRKIYNK